jgi:hypothetical protein
MPLSEARFRKNSPREHGAPARVPTCRKYPSEVPAGSCGNGAKGHQLFFELSESDDIRMFAFELRELSD